MFERFGSIRGASREKTPREIADERLGDYITKHDMPSNGHRRDRTTNTVLVVLAGMMGAIAALEGIAIIEMLPLYKVVPFFVTFSDKADQVVRIEPPSGRILGIAILAEQNVKDYVTQRNTITADTNETIDRWGGRMRLMSSEDVYSAFLLETKPMYEQLRTGNFTRSIQIRSVLDQKGGLYSVEFDAYDHRQGTGLSDTSDTRTTYIAQLRYNLQPRRVSYDQRMLNALGFTVIEYSVAKKRG